MNKSYAVLEIKAVNDSGGRRTFRGVASTPKPDRSKDVVEPKGARFKLPMPFLWYHNQKDPIGWVTKATITAKGIEVEGEVAVVDDPGQLKDRLDLAWQSLKSKLVRGLSIGWRPVEYSYINGTGGLHVKEWEWLELSAVTIPDNEDATVTAIKAAANGHIITGRGTPITKGIKMHLQEQLASMVAARATKAARLTELSELIRTKSAGDAELTEFDQLTGEIEGMDNDIRLKKAEIIMAGTAKPVQPPVETAPTVIVKTKDAEEKFKGQNYTRMVIAKAVGQLDGISPLVVAEQRWGKTNPTLVTLVKAAVAGGGSGSGEWAAELVAADTRYTGDFIDYLKEKTVFDQLPLREVPANVQIKGQDGAATGYWVGESKPIPASAQSFSSVNLTPLKVAALAVVSNELLRDSTPAAEMLVRDALVAASSQRVDATFISATAASAGVSPAGILNGLSAGSTAGSDADGIRADVKALYSGFITAKNASGLQFVMNPALAKAIQLLTNALGLAEFPGITQDGGMLLGDKVVTGDNVNANHIILLKPSDIYRIGDLGVQVFISREAVVEMDNAPTGASDTPVAASTAMVSMFQSESTAIKVVRPINFALRRSDAVAYIEDADYGETSS